MIQTQFEDLLFEVPALYRILDDLREDVEHVRNRRHDLTSTVQSHCVDRSDDRPQFVFSLGKNDREHRALRDELQLARLDIATCGSVIPEVTGSIHGEGRS